MERRDGSDCLFTQRREDSTLLVHAETGVIACSRRDGRTPPDQDPHSPDPTDQLRADEGHELVMEHRENGCLEVILRRRIPPDQDPHAKTDQPRTDEGHELGRNCTEL